MVKPLQIPKVPFLYQILPSSVEKSIQKKSQSKIGFDYNNHTLRLSKMPARRFYPRRTFITLMRGCSFLFFITMNSESAKSTSLVLLPQVYGCLILLHYAFASILICIQTEYIKIFKVYSMRLKNYYYKKAQILSELNQAWQQCYQCRFLVSSAVYSFSFSLALLTEDIGKKNPCVK